MIWINVGPQAPATNPQPVGIKGKGITTDNVHVQLHRRKVEALHLLLSFVVSTKHYLREEDGLNYPDYLGVLPASFVRTASMASGHYPSKAYSMTSHDGTVSGQTTPDSIRPDATKRVRVKRSKHQLMDPSTPLLCEHRTVDFASEDASFPLPLLIAHELSRIIYGFRRDGFLETVGPAGLNAFTQQISGFVSQLTAMERIANTPIPKSYAIHLKQCVSLYLFALPMTLVNDLGWTTVPLVTAVAFTFMGIEGIADEIEMPFGHDERDLPLDRYCEDLKEEINYMIERLPEGGEGWRGFDDGEGDD
jgi:putative membrane protein